MRAQIDTLDRDEAEWLSRYAADPKVAALYEKQRKALRDKLVALEGRKA